MCLPIRRWSIEGVGGVLMVVSVSLLVLDDQTLQAGGFELALPLLTGCTVIMFGRWIATQTAVSFSPRERVLIALSHLIGGILFVGLTGWIIFVVTLEGGVVDRTFPVLLNGMALGMLGNGPLGAIYLQMRNQQRALSAQNERLERFASIVSHDLRNPLNVATGYVTLTRETESLVHLDRIERALDRMEALVTDLRELTRQSDVVRETEAVELEQVSRSAWDIVQTDDVAFECVESVQFEADRTRLQQAFENLFRNAIQHGGDSLSTVRVGRLNSSGFYIEDDGAGIPPDAHDAIFEWETTMSESGTGLGLAIVQEIIEAHGWMIRSTASDSGGARFEVTGVDPVDLSSSSTLGPV